VNAPTGVSHTPGPRIYLAAGHGYTVTRDRGGIGDVKLLRCQHCPFSVHVPGYRRLRDKSGLPRYNRARAVMVRHIYAEHRAAIAKAEGQAQ
jgi:hypothetical protein